VKIGDPDHDWVCGRHSGIPDCCIRFFIGPWREIYANPPHHAEYWHIMKDIAPMAEYILCPECIVESRVVTTKECDCGEMLNENR